MNDQLAAFDIAPADTISVGIRLTVGVAREPRRRCPSCSKRRVMYRIAVSTGPLREQGGSSGARCAPCWGFRG